MFSPTQSLRKLGLNPPASLMLGILSGGLAGVTILPTSFPLKYRVVSAERTLIASNAANTARLATSHIENGATALMNEWQLTHVTILDADFSVKDQAGLGLPNGAIDATCGAPLGGLLYNTPSGTLAIGCATTDNGIQVITATSPTVTQGRQITLMVVILSFIVGILTALGVLVILRPISRIRDALIRVGEGQRGVHLAKTGYNELDDLITQLNQAARAMELREDETEGRLRLMQEMARIVAHEVRNPLQTIELMTSLLEDEQSTSERHEITESLHQEIRNLDQVVTSFLEKGSTIESLSIQTKVRSLTQIVEQTLYIHRYAAETLGIKLNARNLQDVDADIDTALLSRAADNIIREVLSLVAAKTGVITIEMTSNQTPGILITATGLKHFPTARDNFRKQTTLAFGVFQAHQGVIQVDQVEDTIVVNATLPPVVSA
jgi:hypothetical protein